MKTYKIILVYLVPAKSKEEALEEYHQHPKDYLEFQSIKEAVPDTNGWLSALRKQLL